MTSLHTHRPIDYLDEDDRPLRCSDCDRPIYYDYADEGYHHALEPGVGCFLIGPEDRLENLEHPLVEGII